MGTSPRTAPVHYGRSINSTKRVSRKFAYRFMAPAFAKHNKVLIDVDLKSCYTCVLLGLYPQSLTTLNEGLKKGLWKYIENCFIEQDVEKHFDKAAVKICVYGSLFQGGSKMMIEGIIKNKAEDIGLKLREFKETPDFESTHNSAIQIASLMDENPVVLDFRELSKDIVYQSPQNLKGPTGHKYLINEQLYKSNFPKFLQSYEFALLSGSILTLIHKYPKTELIGHFHDGAVLAVDKDELEETQAYLRKAVQDLGCDLNLEYPQDMEIQDIYEPLDEEIIQDISNG